MTDHHDTDEEFEKPSKSALKRQMTALQKLGEAMVELSDRELERMPIDNPRLREVIVEARGIRSNSARRRHMQFLGKLMRNVDPEPLEQAMEELHQRRLGEAEIFKELESWRDRLLADGDEAAEKLIDRWPDADRQQIRQLIRQHGKENAAGKPPAASRKLFRYLRELAVGD